MDDTVVPGSRPVTILSVTVGVGPNSYGEAKAHDRWHFFSLLKPKVVDDTDPVWSQANDAVKALLEGIRNDLEQPLPPSPTLETSWPPSTSRLESIKDKLKSTLSKSSKSSGDQVDSSSQHKVRPIPASYRHIDATIRAAVKYYKMYSDKSSPAYLPGMTSVGWEVRTESEQLRLKEDLAKPGFIGRFHSWRDEAYPGRGEHSTHQTLPKDAVQLLQSNTWSYATDGPVASASTEPNKPRLDEWWG